jgi:NAD(P)-dependent dehydrogenase (short-subunit alcohol dehydrogenase family)
MALLNDKVVLVTGASAGIGRAAAVACGREGARLVVSSHRAALKRSATRRMLGDLFDPNLAVLTRQHCLRPRANGELLSRIRV